MLPKKRNSTTLKKWTAPKRKQRLRVVLFGFVLLGATGLGLMAAYQAGVNSKPPMPVLADQLTIKQAVADITMKYVQTGSVNCTNNSSAEWVTSFYKYLKVNAYANRAVIRTCNANDTLLAKVDGVWSRTDVNLNLDARANPAWSRACYINDILASDTVVRPENNSIDEMNLKLCKELQVGKDGLMIIR